MVFGIADMNFGLCDMKSYTPDVVCAPLAPVKAGCGKGRPVKIITDNSVKTLVSGNTEISHPCIHTVPQRCVVGSSSIHI